MNEDENKLKIGVIGKGKTVLRSIVYWEVVQKTKVEKTCVKCKKVIPVDSKKAVRYHRPPGFRTFFNNNSYCMDCAKEENPDILKNHLDAENPKN